MTRVSLICTVLNEADNIADLIISIMAQTRQPDEIVINDCGSRDNTVAIINDFIDRKFPIRLVHGGTSISTGRNNAIEAAAGPIIVRIDAGLTLEPEFIEKLVAPVEKGIADFTAGHAYPAPQSLLEAVSSEMLYLRLPAVYKAIAAGVWHAPGRNGAAYYKSDWEAVGGYAHYLDATEDRVMALRMRRLGRRYMFVPDAKVHFRPRENLQQLFRQGVVYSYWTAFGRDEGQMGMKKIADYAARIVLGIMLPIIAVRALFNPMIAKRLMLVVLAWFGWEAYGIRTLLATLPVEQKAKGALLTLPIRLAREYGRLYGTTKGLWRWYVERPAPGAVPAPTAAKQKREGDGRAAVHTSS
jgi:glycosyltransferase involved in cell wall biosynthesis